MTDEQIFAATLLAGAHSIEALKAEFRSAPAEDGEVDLTAVDHAALDSLRGSKVAPIPGVRDYLASGDALTNHVIDLMEQAMETAYQIEAPFFITTMREGKDGKNLRVCYFYLDRE